MRLRYELHSGLLGGVLLISVYLVLLDTSESVPQEAGECYKLEKVRRRELMIDMVLRLIKL